MRADLGQEWPKAADGMSETLKKFGLYRQVRDLHGDPSQNLKHHGQSEKETSFKDEQAQAPEALEVESPQKTYVAEVS